VSDLTKQSFFFLPTKAIVIVLISIGVAFVLILLVADPHEPFDRSACKSNLKSIGLVLKMYAESQDGRCPDSLFRLYPNYVADPKVFSCPSARRKEDQSPRPTPGDALAFDYVYFGDGYVFPDEDSMRGDRSGLAKKILAADKASNHPEKEITAVVHVLFANGVVLELPAEEFQKLVRDKEFAR
jgi:hypothetical protein